MLGKTSEGMILLLSRKEVVRESLQRDQVLDVKCVPVLDETI